MKVTMPIHIIGDGYFYGITNENTEIIGIVEKDNVIVPIIYLRPVMRIGKNISKM